MKLNFLSRGNIKSRIMKALLGAAALSLISFAAVSLDGMKRLGDFSLQSSAGLGEESLKISKAALENLTKDGLLRITTDRANLCNNEFEEIEGTVKVLSDIAEKLWNNPALYPKNRSYSFTETPKSPNVFSVYQYPKGVEFNRIKTDLDTSSSMDSFFKPFFTSNSNISDFDIGTPAGLFRRFPWGSVSPDYDVRKRDWFKRTAESGKEGWSAPYVGAIAKNLRINYAKPVYRDNRLVAVVSANIALQTINERIISTRFNNMGSAVLVDRNRRIIAREGMITNAENWADPQKAEYFNLDENSRDKQAFAEELLSENNGIHRVVYNGKESFIAHALVKATHWSVLFIMPVEAINAPILPTEKALMLQSETVRSQVAEKIRLTLLVMSLMFFLSLGIVYFVARRMAKLVTDPIMTLEDGVRIIGNGNLEHLIEINSGDEIQGLAETFNKMTSDLRQYIFNLTETTATRERIQSELNMAADIQANLLPRIFPAFPHRLELDIFALMEPAKEVGGDFYDFFFIDDHRLCFLIADVSDKGVPAALYMMVAKTLLKTEAQRMAAPADILSRVNNILAEENDTCMFVTVFCAILDTRNGEVQFANAGHNPPLVASQEGVEYMSPKAGFVLGPMTDIAYESESLTLKQGDILFLYTDGVTEAMNPEKELFGEQRLIDAMKRSPTESMTEMIHFIQEDLRLHVCDAAQSDDITMLAVRFKGIADATYYDSKL